VAGRRNPDPGGGEPILDDEDLEAMRPAPDLADALPEGVTARERPPVEIKGVGQVAAVELAPA
jgi:hypothetical protein